ncbi:hypothetical protein GC173_00665 [bacterium]|nr:hypothetical protein [bacterium]
MRVCVPALLLLVSLAAAEPTHLIGIHDDSPRPSEFLARAPGGAAWITATEALGADPGNTSGKAYDTSGGQAIIARLNYGYNPDGTLPPKNQYPQFAQRVANFVAGSTGSHRWVIGNETNLSAEWPAGESILPPDYAECYVQCYHAIKAIPGKGPDQEVLVQALAPWAGPYAGQDLNWVDYYHLMVDEITARGVTPDGFALHINTRGYGAADRQPLPIEAGGLTLDFSWLVYRDWIQFGIPRALWDKPLYATECNGLNYWDGSGPAPDLANPAYVPGWTQAVYTDINAWNQDAALYGMPVYRSINLYRWESDLWSINQSSQKAQILSDIEATGALGFTAPQTGGIRTTLATPGGAPFSGTIIASASSDASQDPAPQTDFEPIRAVDGNSGTWWASRDNGPSAAHWLMLDLQSVQGLSGLVVRHSSTENRRTRGFLLEVADAPSDPWRIVTMVRVGLPGQTVPEVTSLSFSDVLETRYIRLYVNDGSNVTSSHRARIVEVTPYVGAASVVYTPIDVDNMGADPIEPWRVHSTSTAIRREPVISAAVMSTLSQGNTIPGVPVLVPSTNEEWLQVDQGGEEGFLTLTEAHRVHPANRVTAGTGIPIGKERVNRWWGSPETYVPPDLQTIPSRYTVQSASLRAEAAQSLMRMLDAALVDGVDIRAGSSYRSWTSQRTIYGNAVAADGRNQRYSAPPGHSEHQLGTTVDFSDPSQAHYLVQSFVDTPQYAWMAANAWRYGWRQSYRPDTESVTGYIEEPWHWRYIGPPSTFFILSSHEADPPGTGCDCVTECLRQDDGWMMYAAVR